LKRRALRLSIVVLTVLFFGIVGVVLFRVLASEKAHTVLLKWKPSVPKPGVTVAGYNIYRSKPDGSFAPLATGIVPPTFVDSKVSRGATYYYFVTAVDATGRESLASNNASAVIP
jgi:fibronectin type 3 domain-containing protein